MSIGIEAQEKNIQEKNIQEKNTPKVTINGWTNIKYEKTGEFKESISYKAYKDAFDITQEIIADNQSYWESVSSKSDGTRRRNTAQICNIIFFTGDRGTGKTSVMLSYMEFLKDYYRNNIEQSGVLPEMSFSDSDLMFTGLEYIDASSLDSREDILGSVLSEMLKKWAQEEKRSNIGEGIVRTDGYEYKKRQIHKSFQKVYVYLKNLRSKKDIMEEDSDLFMETLENMSMTGNLKQAFQDLVSDYLDIMKYPISGDNISKAKHFLVISIDDIDLNIDKGFELLEQIRKYLMLPNIIVLLSACDDQLERVCVNYYTDKFREIKNEHETQEYILKSSREYLEKMVPARRKIVLKSGRKWEFSHERKIEISYASVSEKKKRFSDTGESEENKLFSGTLEDIVSEDMARYLGAKFLSGGKVLYYLTPDTMRELVSWITQMNHLKEISEMELGGEEESYSQNLEWFWHQQFYWMTKKYLRIADWDVFAAMDVLEPSEQVEVLKEYLQQQGLVDKRLGRNGTEAVGKRSLMEILGKMCQGSLRKQELSALSILYFSVKFSENMMSMQWLKGKAREEKMRGLMQYYQGGIWGNWEQDMMPAFVDTKASEESFVKFGYIEFENQKKFFTMPMKGELDGGKWESIQAFVIRNQQNFINYQYLLLFYRIDLDDESVDDLGWMIGERNALELKRETNGFFCLSNFVLNVFEGAKLSQRFIRELPYVLCQGHLENLKETEELVKGLSVLKTEGGVDIWPGKDLLPLNNMEYLISLGMDIERRMKTGQSEEANRSAVGRTIKLFFQIIKDDLSKYDQEYFKDFAEFPIASKILKNDHVFIDLLLNSISTFASGIIEDKEWGESNG